jgi:hypothetical protein
MWYKAASVITAIKQCGQLDAAANTIVPSCPKKGNNIYCLSDFPECEGKDYKCPQKLQLVNEKGDLAFLYFDYYLTKNERDGKIKKLNTTLRRFIVKYHINERLMVPIDTGIEKAAL